MAQTAVEWLVKIYLQTKKIDSFDIEQAKQMEKEQTVNAWERGKYIGMSFPQGFIPNEYEQDGEQYYNETYGKE